MMRRRNAGNQYPSRKAAMNCRTPKQEQFDLYKARRTMLKSKAFMVK
jgi:hypothetical protein